MANPYVVVDFLANTTGLSKGLKKASGESTTFGGRLKSLGKAGALAAGAAGVGALVATVKIGIDEYTEATKVATQTNAVIKSTGQAANVTAGHVADLAGAIMKKSGIDDEAVQSGENLLLTFTNIRNEVGAGNDIFDQTTSIMADMSVALGQDMKSSAMQLGKALNNPIKGMSALQRVGVSFTDAQKDQVKAMVASGDTMGAQKLILRELTKEFGGSAEAAGKTLPGQINIAKQTFNNFAGMLVAKVIPVIEDAIAWLRDHWPEISRVLKQFWSGAKPILAGLADLFGEVVDVVKKNWPTIGPIVQGVARVITDVMKIIGTALKLVVDLLHGDWAAAWDDAKKIVGLAIDAIKTEITTEINAVLSIATRLGKAFLDGITTGASGVVTWITNKIDDIKKGISDAASGVYNAALTFGGKILSGVVAGITGIVTDVQKKLNDIAQGITDTAATVYQKSNALGGKILAGILAGIGNLAGEVREKISGAWSWGEEFLGNALAAGKRIGNAIVNGFKDALSGLANLLKAPINAVIKAWNQLEFTVPTIKIPGWGAVKIHGHTVVPGFGGFTVGGQTFGTPDVPLLAKGGVVEQPTLAMIGEGSGREIVAPESLLRQLLSEVTPSVRVFIGDRELRDLVRVEVVSEQNRTAQTLIAGLAT